MAIWRYFCFRYHLGLCTMQELSYLGKVTPVSIWFMMMLTQIITRVFKDSLILTYLPNINIWLILQFWYPQVGSLISLLMLIYWHRASTYIPVQHWLWPNACEELMIPLDRSGLHTPSNVQLGHQVWETCFKHMAWLGGQGFMAAMWVKGEVKVWEPLIAQKFL